MSIKTVMLAVAAVIAPTAAWALGGGAGCADLPEYDRAMGALEGMTGACDMTVEQARRIVAAQQGQAAPGPAAIAPSPLPHRHRRHHRVRPLRD